MAILTKYGLGLPSGKAGDMIYRVRNGKVHMYPYNAHIKVSNSEKAVANRKRWGFTTRFCSALNKQAFLKMVWKKACKKGTTPFNKLVTANFPRNLNVDNISDAALVPRYSYWEAVIENISFVINEIVLEIRITTPVEYLSYILHHELSAQGIMLLKNPTVEMPNDFEFIPLRSLHIEYRENENLIFHIPIIGEDHNLFNIYGSKKFVINLCFKEGVGKDYSFSRNISGEIE